MSGKRFNVLSERPLSQREQYESTAKRMCDDYWNSTSLEKLDPFLTALGQERIERTWDLIRQQVPSFKEKAVVDLGCGSGALAAHFAEQGSQIVGVDGAEKALNHCDKKGIPSLIAQLPYVKLADESFEGALLTDVIAEITPSLYRLTLSEVARLLTKEGWFVCSTPLDLYSEDALFHFFSLIQSEFKIVTQRKSYHRLYFYCRRFLEAPSRFVTAAKCADYRGKQLEKRGGLMRLWFYLNTLKAIAVFLAAW